MVQIITDSAADFEPWELEKLNVTCIPLTVAFDEQEYQENVNLSKVQFYEKLAAAQSLPKTAQPSPQILLDAFSAAAEKGNEAIYICLSSALSGTYQSALMTGSMVDSHLCHVVDSRNATGGQRMIVEHAVKLRDAGKTAAEIVAEVELLRERITLFACMDTLENLYMGGRISHTIYKLGTMANIKPIITVDPTGSIQVPAKAIGLRRGMDSLCKMIEKAPVDPAFPFYVMYTDNRENARTFAQVLQKTGLEIPEERIIQVGAAIGTHVGPNAVGYVYVSCP